MFWKERHSPPLKRDFKKEKKKEKAKDGQEKGSIYYSVGGTNTTWLFSALRSHPGDLNRVGNSLSHTGLPCPSLAGARRGGSIN